MIISARVLGARTAHLLEERAAAPLLVIGSDKFTRHDLATIDCFNFIAAYRLSTAIAALGVSNTRDLFDHIPPSAFAIPGIGSIAIAVLGACFERKGIGGSTPLDNWIKTHTASDAKRAIVSFDRYKQRALDMVAARAERKAAKQRRHARRDTAHRLRVDRFTKRQHTRGTAHAAEKAHDRRKL
jgi:hypothetical protein